MAQQLRDWCSKAALVEHRGVQSQLNTRNIYCVGAVNIGPVIAGSDGSLSQPLLKNQ